MFPVLKYHNRWKKLSFQEIFEQNRATYHNYRKGQALSNNIGSYTRGEWMLQDGSSEEISTAVEADFEAFMPAILWEKCVMTGRTPGVFEK